MAVFKNDKILSNIDISPYDVISFDIFDTLLFRLSALPEDIFQKVGMEAIEKYKDDFFYSPIVFAELRKKAERVARRKNKNEITIYDIYDELPFVETVKEFLLKKELELESKYLMVNEYIYSFLQYCYSQGKKIIIISDMYLTLSQIKKIFIDLNIDIKLIEEIFVSSEYKATKANGQLYEIVKGRWKNNILHIGDNYYSDWMNARDHGIDSIYYNAIPEKLLNIYKMEEHFTKNPINELRTIRKLAGHTSLYNDKELEWYKMGAEIFGPVYSIFCEWVVHFAVRNGIKVILPLMREGMLLSKIIKNIIIREKLDIKVEPFYISRKASYLPGLKSIQNKDILEMVQKNYLTIKNLVSLLDINIKDTIFAGYANETLANLKKIKINDTNLYDELSNYLTSNEKIKEINRNIEKQKEYLKCYIQDLSDEKPFITVDFGYNGTIQQNINHIIGDRLRATHLILIGKNKALDKIINGMNIISWLGFMAERPKEIKTIVRSPEIIEAVANIASPSTMKYELSKDGNVDPVMDNYEFPKFHQYFQEICWEGIFGFQELWFKIKDKGFILDQLLGKQEGFLAVFQRLTLYPLHHEAVNLGALFYHENYNYTRSAPVVKEGDIQLLQEMGVESFINKTSQTIFPYEVVWPQGVVENVYKDYFINQYLKDSLDDELLKNIFTTLKDIEKNKYDHIYFYGAGELGRKMYEIAKLLNINVRGFIDRNYERLNEEFYELQVFALEQVSKRADLIVIASLSFKNEIKEMLMNYYKNSEMPEILELK